MKPMEIVMKLVSKFEMLTKGVSLSAFALTLGASVLAAPSAQAASSEGPVAAPDTIEVAGLEGVKPDMLPKVLVSVTPDYPSHAKAIGREGWVIVELDIDDKGMPMNAEIVDSGPSALFERTTLRAIEKFRFEPAMYAGEPVSVTGKRYKVVYSFQTS